MRQWLTYVLAVPLMAAGIVFAHGLAYRLVTPDPQMRARELAESGHGYLAYAPAAVAILTALALACLAARVFDARRGLSGSRLGAAPFALLPPLAFALQEHLERLAHTGAFPVAASLEPTFLVGLALQIPFGIVAYALARALLAVADALGGALAQPAPPRRETRATPQRCPGEAVLPRIAILALGHAERGPPQLALS